MSQMFSNSKRAIFWLGIMLTLVGVLGYQLAVHRDALIETNVLALLPKDRQNPMVETAFDQISGTMEDKVVFLLSSDDVHETIKAADQFVAEISALGLCSDLTGRISESQQQSWGQLYFPNRFQMLSVSQQERLAQHPDKQSLKVVEALYNPFSGVTGGELQNDPFLLFREFITELTSSSSKLKLSNGFLTASDEGKEYILITGTLSASAYSHKMGEKLSELVKIEDRLQQQYKVDIQHTGVVFYATAGVKSAKKEISTIGFGSLLGILILLLSVYRSPLPLLLSLLSIACGLLSAFVLTVAVFGKVHLFSLVFGASLIGVSIDYAFHFLTDRLASGSAWNVDRGLKHIFAAITFGLITSLMGYLGLLIAPFPGLQQLSLFSAVGLIAAYGTVVCWYPTLAKSAPRHSGLPFAHTIQQWLSYWKKPSVYLALPIILFGLALIGIYRSSYNDDIRQLQSLPPELKQQEDAIKSMVGVGHSSQSLLVTGADEDSVLQQLEKVSLQLEKLREEGALDGYQSLSQYVPSEGTQQENYRLIKNLYALEGGELSAKLNLKTPISFDQPFAPLTLDAFFDSPVSEPLRFLWLDDFNAEDHWEEKHACASVIMLRGVHKADEIKALVADQDHVAYLDKASEISSLFGEYRVRITQLLIGATLAILLLVSWRYGIRKGALIVIPPFIAGCAGLAITPLFGLSLNLFNLLALILILGIGIDYTLFFVEQDSDRPSSLQGTFLAITLSAITTMLSFGLLALSETQAIQSFGITILFGILISWLLAPLAMKKSIQQRVDEEGKE